MNDPLQAHYLFNAATRSWPRPEPALAGQVAIITRTKDRPLLLRRACESVLAQTYRNWQMVVVNDGGQAQAVEDVLAPYRPSFEGRLHVVHNPHSLGMEAASNIGLRACNSEFVVILDDDDTWHPEFLQESALTLTDAGNPGMGGVTCHVKLVHERIENGEIHFESESEYNSWMSSISFDRLLAENCIATCAFLYRRAIHAEIGDYNESLPVLGDWEFLIRFMLVADIGVICKPLAHYHHRTNFQGTPYHNSVLSISFSEYNVFSRNAALREIFATNPQLIGLAISLNQNLLNITRSVANLSSGDNALVQFKENVLWQIEQHNNHTTSQIEHFNNTLSQQFETLQKDMRVHEEHVSRSMEELFRNELRMHSERCAAHTQERLAKIDELHLWLGILTWPLRVVWRPFRQVLLRIASAGK